MSFFSLYDRVQYLTSNSKKLIYQKYLSSQFPIKVRQLLAIWIENNILHGYDFYVTPDNPDYPHRIAHLAANLINETQAVSDNLGFDTDFTQENLRSNVEYFRSLPLTEVYTRLADCLKEEIRLLRIEEGYHATSSSGGGGGGDEIAEKGQGQSQGQGQGHGQGQHDQFPSRNNPVFVEMSTRVCTIVNQRNELVALFDSMQTDQKELMNYYQSRASAVDFHRQLSQQQQPGVGSSLNGYVVRRQDNSSSTFQTTLNQLDNQIVAKTNNLQSTETQYLVSVEVRVTELEALVGKLLLDFVKPFQWSDCGLNETPAAASLDEVQRWYTDLMETISQISHILRQRETDAAAATGTGTQVHHGHGHGHGNLQHAAKDRILRLQQRLDLLFSRMMSSSLVADVQPSQVIKKDSKVLRNNECPTVRFLCGEKFLTLSSPPVVRAVVINERQALELHGNNGPSKEIYLGCGKVINSTGAKLVNPRSSSRLIHQFKNLSVANIRRVHKKSEKRAMTEKFCFLYLTQFTLNGKPYEIWCCSIPFVWIVHVSQKSEAWATVFWDSASRERNRSPFSVPEAIPWSRMAPSLNTFFKVHTETSWNLTDVNLKYLGEKLFGTTDFSDRSVVHFKKMFSRESPSRPGFWEWFYAIIELTQKHLTQFWDKGYIVGFIHRCRDAEPTLSQLSPGTFLLRFSDSALGGLSISYIYLKHTNGQQVNHVESLNPFTDSDLKIRKLADRLNDVMNYISVYHYTPTNEAFVTLKSVAFPPEVKEAAINNGLLVGQATSVRKPYVSSEVIMVISSGAASTGTGTGTGGPSGTGTATGTGTGGGIGGTSTFGPSQMYQTGHANPSGPVLDTRRMFRSISNGSSAGPGPGPGHSPAASPDIGNTEFQFNFPQSSMSPSSQSPASLFGEMMAQNPGHRYSRSNSQQSVPSFSNQQLQQQQVLSPQQQHPKLSLGSQSQPSPQQQVPEIPYNVFEDIIDTNMLELTADDHQIVDFLSALEDAGDLNDISFGFGSDDMDMESPGTHSDDTVEQQQTWL